MSSIFEDSNSSYPKDMTYEKRVVAFIDILGFKEKVSSTVSGKGFNQKINQSNVSTLIKLFKLINDIWDDDGLQKYYKNYFPGYKLQRSKSKKITSFSDSIVISFLIEEPIEIFYTIIELEILQSQMLLKGFIIRGSIVYGQMIHTDKFLFGPALLEAYETESRAALYPRIVLDKSLLKIIKEQYKDKEARKELEAIYRHHLKQDSDGMFYINYFSEPSEKSSFADLDIFFLIMLELLIRNGLRSRKPDIRIKYMWMKDKFNRLMLKIYKLKGKGEIVINGNKLKVIRIK